MKLSINKQNSIQEITYPDVARLEEQIAHKDEKMAEFAWITSHRLRANLSRIMGLINLTDGSEELCELNKTIIDLLKNEAEAMDEVVRQMNHTLTADAQSQMAKVSIQACA